MERAEIRLRWALLEGAKAPRPGRISAEGRSFVGVDSLERPVRGDEQQFGKGHCRDVGLSCEHS
jgi:hypothetical protein